MSREAIAACRTAVELILEVSKEAMVKTLAAKALGSLTELALREEQGRKREADRKRSWRGGRPPDVPGTTERVGPRDVPGTSAGMAGTSVGGGLGGDLSGDPGDMQKDPKTPTVGDPGEGPRDVPGTAKAPHRNGGPAIANGSMLVDAWLEGMRAATGQPSWIRLSVPLGAIRTLQAVLETTCPKPDADACAWAFDAAKAYVATNPEGRWSTFAYQTWEQSGRPAQRTPGGKAPERDPAEVQRAARARNAESEATVRAAFAAHPAPTIASHRPPTVPTTITGSRPTRVELTPEERERRRQAQLDAAAAFQVETQKAEAP